MSERAHGFHASYVIMFILDLAIFSEILHGVLNSRTLVVRFHLAVSRVFGVAYCVKRFRQVQSYQNGPICGLFMVETVCNE